MQLQVLADDAVQRTWKVNGMSLVENPSFTHALLKIQNISSAPIQQARFYAEYYDAAGRRCFTLAFSSDTSRTSNGIPIEAGSVHELHTMAGGLGPASDPVTVKLHLISQIRTREGDEEIASGNSIVSTPVMAGSPSTAEWHKLHLELGTSDPPIVDLILARVTVSSSGGKPESVQILNARDDEIRKWFTGFIQQPWFSPATAGFKDVPGETLIFIRAIKGNLVDIDPATLLSRRSPWLQDFRNKFGAPNLPNVTQILFEREPLITAIGRDAEYQQRILDASPTIYDLTFAGAEWSLLRKDLATDRSHPTLRWATAKELHQ
ncbi:MAG TPA: hypothetical protein VFW83_05125 [Bryobacteraceae bacterium]|nr:hypothetical protein [Bryobacteraceae bacterium]